MSDPLGLRVVSGSPDDAELAAVVTVLLAAVSARAGGPAGIARRSLWGDPATLVRHTGAVQPGGWATPRL